jgi:hypothetical protein
MASTGRSLCSTGSSRGPSSATTEDGVVRRSKRPKTCVGRAEASTAEDIHTLATSIFPCLYMSVGGSLLQDNEDEFDVYLRTVLQGSSLPSSALSQLLLEDEDLKILLTQGYLRAAAASTAAASIANVTNRRYASSASSSNIMHACFTSSLASYSCAAASMAASQHHQVNRR